jgi:hypothetical protein
LPAIALSVTGLPGQVLGSFSSGAGSALGFSSTLTVSATNAAANPGTNLVVMGTDDRVSSGGSRSSTVVLVILTPAQASQLIIDQINQLQSQGALNQGQANSLITKLSHAITSLIAKKGMPCNQLDAFVNEVNAYLQAGILTQAQVDLLLGGPLGINAIMLAIPC